MDDLEPLTLTRPASALRLGAGTLGDRIFRAFAREPNGTNAGAIVRPYLAAIERERAPDVAVNDEGWLARGPAVVACSRWLPPGNFIPPAASRPWLGFCQGRPACGASGPEFLRGLRPGEVEGWFERLALRANLIEVGGEWIDRPWDLVAKNSRALVDDFTDGASTRGLMGLDARVALVGPSDRARVHPSARIDPYTVFDTTDGPITVESGVWIQPFTRLEGPCHVGRDTQLFRANVRGGTTIGPNCRIGGEVEASIIFGHSNKYHEGFLGHAYVGEWVNLGAITSNSDLRNDYGEVQVPLQGDPAPTGATKVGCFLGDHTRSGLGSMLNTGTVAGVMCNVLPAGSLLPKHIPSFSAVTFGRVTPGVPLDRMFATARVVKGRRGQVFSRVEEALYEDLHERTRLERERAFLKARTRRDARSDAEAPASGPVESRVESREVRAGDYP